MANAFYPLYKQAVLGASANSDLTGSGATGVWCALVDTGVYTYSAAHQYYSDLGASTVGTDVEVTGITYALGVIDGADITFTTVSGNSIEALVLYRKNAGANTTWRLIAYMDTNITGLPLTPTSVNVIVTWNASGICAI